MIIKKTKKNKGFVLLFAVMLSSIILAISLGVASIALKELNFTTSAKDTNNALFAADTGIECALNNDKSTSNIFGLNGTGTSINCLGGSISFLTHTGTVTSALYNFVISGLGSSVNSCANVTLTKIPDVNNILITTVTSKGYNNGGGSGGCTPNSTSVERELQVVY